MWHRVQVINNFETRFLAEIVDTGDVEQVIERKLIATKFCDPNKVSYRDCTCRFAAKFSLVLKFSFKRFVQRFDSFPARHSLITLYCRRSACGHHDTRQAKRLPYNSNLNAASCQRFFQFFRQLGLLIFESVLPRNFFL